MTIVHFYNVFGTFYRLTWPLWTRLLTYLKLSKIESHSENKHFYYFWQFLAFFGNSWQFLATLDNCDAKLVGLKMFYNCPPNCSCIQKFKIKHRKSITHLRLVNLEDYKLILDWVIRLNCAPEQGRRKVWKSLGGSEW